MFDMSRRTGLQNKKHPNVAKECTRPLIPAQCAHLHKTGTTRAEGKQINS